MVLAKKNLNSLKKSGYMPINTLNRRNKKDSNNRPSKIESSLTDKEDSTIHIIKPPDSLKRITRSNSTSPNPEINNNNMIDLESDDDSLTAQSNNSNDNIEIEETKYQKQKSSSISQDNINNSSSNEKKIKSTASQMFRLEIDKLVVVTTSNKEIQIKFNEFLDLYLRASKLNIISDDESLKIQTSYNNIKVFKTSKSRLGIKLSVSIMELKNDLQIQYKSKLYSINKLIIYFKYPLETKQLKTIKLFIGSNCLYQLLNSQELIKYQFPYSFEPSESDKFYGSGNIESNSSMKTDFSSLNLKEKPSSSIINKAFSSLSSLPPQSSSSSSSSSSSPSSLINIGLDHKSRTHRRGTIIKYKNEDSEDEKANEKMVSENGEIFPIDYIFEDDQLILEPNLKFKFDNRKTFTITNNDFKCLYNGNWINDTLVDFFLNYHLKLAKEKKIPKANNIEILNSFFFTSLSRPRENNDHYENVKSWFKMNDNLFDKDFVIIPIMQDLHWYFVVITDLKALKRKHLKLLKGKIDEEENKDSFKDDNDMDENNENIENLKVIDDSQPTTNHENKNQNQNQNYLLNVNNDKSNENEIETDNDDSLIENIETNNVKDNENVLDSLLSDSDNGRNNKLNETEKKNKSITKAAEEKINGVVQICILDSLYRNHEKEIGYLKDFIIGYGAEKYNFEIKPNEIVKHKCIVPKQNNFNDCGLHLVLNVETMLADPVTFNKRVLKRSPKGLKQTIKMKKENESLFNSKKMLNIRLDLRNLLFDLLKKQVMKEGGDISQIGVMTTRSKKLLSLKNEHKASDDSISGNTDSIKDNSTTGSTDNKKQVKDFNKNARGNNHDDRNKKGIVNYSDSDSDSDGNDEGVNGGNSDGKNDDSGNGNDGDDVEDDDLVITHAKDKEPIIANPELLEIKTTSETSKYVNTEEPPKVRSKRGRKKKQFIVKLPLDGVSRTSSTELEDLDNISVKNLENSNPKIKNKNGSIIKRSNRPKTYNTKARKKLAVDSDDLDFEPVARKKTTRTYKKRKTSAEGSSNKNTPDIETKAYSGSDVLSQESYHNKSMDDSPIKLLESDYELVEDIGNEIDKILQSQSQSQPQSQSKLKSKSKSLTKSPKRAVESNVKLKLLSEENVEPDSQPKTSSKELMDEMDKALNSPKSSNRKFDIPLSPINLESETKGNNEGNENFESENKNENDDSKKVTKRNDDKDEKILKSNISKNEPDLKDQNVANSNDDKTKLGKENDKDKYEIATDSISARVAEKNSTPIAFVIDDDNEYESKVDDILNKDIIGTKNNEINIEKYKTISDKHFKDVSNKMDFNGDIITEKPASYKSSTKNSISSELPDLFPQFSNRKLLNSSQPPIDKQKNLRFTGLHDPNKGHAVESAIPLDDDVNGRSSDNMDWKKSLDISPVKISQSSVKTNKSETLESTVLQNKNVLASPFFLSRTLRDSPIIELSSTKIQSSKNILTSRNDNEKNVRLSNTRQIVDSKNSEIYGSDKISPHMIYRKKKDYSSETLADSPLGERNIKVSTNSFKTSQNLNQDESNREEKKLKIFDNKQSSYKSKNTLENDKNKKIDDDVKENLNTYPKNIKSSIKFNKNEKYVIKLDNSSNGDIIEVNSLTSMRKLKAAVSETKSLSEKDGNKGTNNFYNGSDTGNTSTDKQYLSKISNEIFGKSSIKNNNTTLSSRNVIISDKKGFEKNNHKSEQPKAGGINLVENESLVIKNTDTSDIKNKNVGMRTRSSTYKLGDNIIDISNTTEGIELLGQQQKQRTKRVFFPTDSSEEYEGYRKKGKWRNNLSTLNDEKVFSNNEKLSGRKKYKDIMPVERNLRSRSGFRGSVHIIGVNTTPEPSPETETSKLSQHNKKTKVKEIQIKGYGKKLQDAAKSVFDININDNDDIVDLSTTIPTGHYNKVLTDYGDNDDDDLYMSFSR